MAEQKSFKAAAFSGAKWTTAASVMTTLSRFLQIAILARLLSPEEFGLAGIVLVVIGFASVFSDAGVSMAIVQRQDITTGQLSSLYWLQIFSGVVVFAALMFATPVIGSFFNYDDLRGLLYLAAPIFLIIPFGQQFQFLLQKELKFDTISKIDVVAILIDTITSLVAAMAGAAAASLIIGKLLSSTVRSVLLIIRGISFHRPRLRFRASDLRGFLSFGMYQMGEKSLNYFQSRIDQLLIGKILGAEPLGYYNLAFNLIIQPVSRINPIVNRVVFPLYAKVQNEPDRLRRGYFLSLKYLSLINFPLLVGLAAVAGTFVTAVYGAAWAPSVLIIQMLAIVGIIKVSMNPIGPMLLAKGRADLAFKWNLFTVFTTSAAIYAVAGDGIIAVSEMMAGISTLYFVIGYNILTKPLIGSCSREIFVDYFIVPLAYSFAMGGSVCAVIRIVPLGGFYLLVTGVVTGVVTYGIIMAVFERKTISDLIMHLKGRIAGG